MLYLVKQSIDYWLLFYFVSLDSQQQSSKVKFEKKVVKCVLSLFQGKINGLWLKIEKCSSNHERKLSK